MRVVIIFTFLLLAFCSTSSAFYNSNWNKDRILLQDVQVLTLRRGEMTTGRRNNPIPQLTCISGKALRESNRVNSIQCKNVGFDGEDIN
jgi:hypothetical protein